MKRLFASCVALCSLSLIACGDDGKNPDNNGNGNNSTEVEVSSNITADTTWTADKTYKLKSYIFVESGTLTIEPGTKILGQEQTALIITRNAKLNAVGTADKPIVFTSAKAEGQRTPGDWGGVVLLGKAKINVAGGENNVEGFPTTSTSENTRYGGTDDTHDCGKLKYARIEFAGYLLAEGNELNGLTTGACGSNSQFDYIQVHKGADDGVEMFGGTADLRHIVITQPDDDGLDYDLGYQGKVQYLVVQQNATVGNRAIEASSNKNDHTAQPQSLPEIWNATFIGSNRAAGTTPAQEGLVFNTGAGVKLNNSIVAWFADRAMKVSDTASVALFDSDAAYINNTFFFDNNTEADAGAGVDNQSVDPQLTDALNLTAPNFAPQANSAALAQVNAATPTTSGIENAGFVGAVGTSNWLAGWTAFPEN